RLRIAAEGTPKMRIVRIKRLALAVAGTVLAAALATAAVAQSAGSGPAPADGGARPTPRYPDGTVRLDRPPGETGYWANPSVSSLFERGVHVEMDEHGLLADIDDAPKVAPFRPWALALYRYRQQNGLKDDPYT